MYPRMGSNRRLAFHALTSPPHAPLPGKREHAANQAAIVAAGINTTTVNATAFSAHITSETATEVVSGSLSAYETKIALRSLSQ